MTLERWLRAIVGDPHVLTDPDTHAAYVLDWTRRWSGRARLVVRPGSTAQTAAVVQACAADGTPVVTQGGNTGLVGGGVPHGEPPPVLLSTRRLTRLDPVDPVAGQLTAGAGVTLGRLHEHARAAGWAYGVDLAARDSATVGGTVATNAGGVRVCAYGDTRRQVVGLEAVLADGSVISHLGGMVKDNTGYDLTGLLTGSEGTLGVVTAARLRLWPPPSPGVTMLLGCDSVTAALAVLPRSGLRAAELMLAAGVELVQRVNGLAAPLAHAWPVYLLLETAELPDLPADVDAAVSPRLWAYRELHTEAISTLGVPHKLDVAVPLGRLAAFVEEVVELTAPHRTFLFGHVAEGNLHVNVVGPPPDDTSVDEAVLRLVAAYGGSISAEHGIGVAKASLLALNRSAAEIAVMRALKRALDPKALLNPGVLLA